MRRIATLAFLFVLNLSSFAQGPELDALAEIVFAQEVKVVLRHLPSEFEKAFATASIQKQRTLAERLMMLRTLEREGIKFVRPDSGPVLIIEPPVREQTVGTARAEVFLDKRMSDGNETMLRFRIKKAGQGEEFDRRGVATIWMRYIDGQWRVYEVDAEGETIKLDDPDFLAAL